MLRLQEALNTLDPIDREVLSLRHFEQLNRHETAQALIQANGKMAGWIGGSCAQPVVLREAARILREGGEPYLLRLGAPDLGIMRKDVRVFPMSCTSGGVLDIYMEPHLPLPQLILIGDSPVIAALRQLASVIDFAVIQLHSADLSKVNIHEQTCILVATHGQYDEDAIEQALRSPACYVGMVGSRRRAEACARRLHCVSRVGRVAGAHRSVHCPRHAPRCGNFGGSRADHLEGAVPGGCGCPATVDGGGSGHHRPQSDRCDVLRWEQRISCDHHADSLDSARRGNVQAGSAPASCETSTRNEWLGRAINRSLTTARCVTPVSS